LAVLNEWSKIGLVTTLQHIHMMRRATDLLRKVGKTVVIGKVSERGRRAGQITGCDYSSAEMISNEVEAFLFLGGGRFHAIGLALATAKPVVVADPFENRAYSIDEDVQRVLKQRWASISEARKATEFGVLIGLKIGQVRVGKAVEIKRKLEKSGKKAVLLAIKEVTPEALIQFHSLNVFINTACPRIGLDESSKFSKPVLTFNEALVMLNELNWETLYDKGWFQETE